LNKEDIYDITNSGALNLKYRDFMFYGLIPQKNSIEPDLHAINIFHSGTVFGKFSVTFFPDKIEEE